jgi:hypothetical protein
LISISNFFEREFSHFPFPVTNSPIASLRKEIIMMITTVRTLILLASLVKADGTMHKFTVQEFCTEHVRTIETYITQLEQSISEREFMSQTGGFICQCEHSTEPILRLRCSSSSLELNSPQADSRNSADRTVTSVVETMEFTLQENIYVPVSVQWCQYFDLLLNDSVYCESYQLNLSTEIKSCSIEDTPCSNDQDSSGFCEVCPGGQTVSATALCNDQIYPIINCTDNYMNSLLYSYQIENNAQITKDGESDSAMCQAGEVESFCSSDNKDGLAKVETHLDQQALQIYTTYEMKENYKCRCIATNDSTVSFVSRLVLDCQAIMQDVGQPDESSVQRRLLTETMVLTVSDPASSKFLTPLSTEWCDAGEQEDPNDFFCESYEFGLGNEGFVSCTVNDCQASFCEICNDDSFIGHSCGSDTTCSTGQPYNAPFLLPYRNLTICSTLSASSASSIVSTGWIGSLLLWLLWITS